MQSSKSNQTQFLFLVGAPRSANSAIHSLLDNHPKILNWPSEFHFFTLFKQVSKGEQFAKVTKLNQQFISHFKDRFEERISRNTLSITKSNYKPGSHIGPFDVTLFEDLLSRKQDSQMTSLEYLNYFFKCYQESNSQYRNKEIDYYSMLCTARGFDWSNRDLFENSKLIFPYRNPLESYSSLRHNYLESISPNEFYDVRTKKGAVYWMRTYQQISNVIKHNENHPNLYITSVQSFRQNQKSQTTKLCQFLNIKKTESTEHMTILGIPYGGNARQESLNTGRISDKPSILSNSVTNFEIDCFRRLNLYEFDSTHTHSQASPKFTILLAFIASFWELKNNLSGLTKSSGKFRLVHWRIKVLIQLFKISHLIRSNKLLNYGSNLDVL